MSGINLIIGNMLGSIVRLGSKLNEIPDGVYIITKEGEYITEEDNYNALLIEETEA